MVQSKTFKFCLMMCSPNDWQTDVMVCVYKVDVSGIFLNTCKAKIKLYNI